MKILTLYPIVALILALPSFAAPIMDGEYLCDDCQGFLTIKANKPGDYKVRLVVGGGSCGGLEFAKNDHVQAKNNKLLLTWKDKKKTCTTEISVEGKSASISDSCIKPEDEDSSTCAVLGDYTKRSSGNDK
jgi:hypothetical protein